MPIYPIQKITYSDKPSMRFHVQENVELKSINQKRLSRKQMINKIKRWISSLEFDVRPLFQTAFQELTIICFLGIAGTVVDHLYLSVHNDKGNAGCTTLLCRNKFPLAFFLAIVIFTVYENRVLPQQTSSAVGLAYKTSTPFHRALQKLIILATLLLINQASAVVYTPQKSSTLNTEDVLKSKFELEYLSIVVLKMAMSLATKLLGTLAVVTFTRLHVDVGISAYQLLTYIPPTNEYLENKKSSLAELDKLNNNTIFEETSGEWR